MIISHKFKFIFIKTYKTAGTSIEVFLSEHCGESDVLTPINPPVGTHIPRNYRGFWNPLPEIIANKDNGLREILRDFYRRKRFYNHIPARTVRSRISSKIWNHYFKFCFERNPWDKTLSHYHMLISRSGEIYSMDEYFRRGFFRLNFYLYTDINGNLLVDKVAKYETFNEDLSEIFGRLGIPFDGTLEVRAKSEYRKNRKPYQQVFSQDQKEIIEQVFNEEIKLHGYSF
jgi:hypothetical protein